MIVLEYSKEAISKERDTGKLYHTILTHHHAWHRSLATDKYNGASALVSIEFCDVLQILQHVHIFLAQLTYVVEDQN